MKILITGASGFLGQYVVKEALKQQHQIKIITRDINKISSLSWANHANIEIINLDLLDCDNLVKALHNIDLVIHLAAAKTGDYQTQFKGTVKTTETLLKAMNQANISRIIAISSFSVYDYFNLDPGTIVTEETPLETNPKNRDEYAKTKLIQESLLNQFSQDNNGQVTIFRPGVIYGYNQLWNARLGIKLGNKLWLKIGNNAQLPLTYVENCAEAIVKAIECQESIGQTINIVDDDLPTQAEYIAKLTQITGTNTPQILISWPLISSLSNLAYFLQQKLFLGKIKLPGILIPHRLHARFKPLQYNNNKAKMILQWQPQFGLEEALKKSI